MRKVRIVVQPAGYSKERAQLFDAFLGDRLLVSRSSVPLFAACRVLAGGGASEDLVVEMVHRGRESDVALTTSVGRGRLLSVKESGLRFCRAMSGNPFSDASE